MREKELRLGVVLTGGISLAIYMHGVSKELLKLTRASRAFHDRRETGGLVPDEFSDHTTRGGIDTEPIYFDLLRSFAPELDLRVVIDVIAGASAGGVTGVFLARALAHDFDLETHRAMWLENADILKLIDEDASAGRWGKIYLTPIVRLLMRGRLGKIAPEPETRSKLIAFIRSRWFKPPFSGTRFSAWLLDACATMSEGAQKGNSLLPEGHELKLSVTVTDFHGHLNRVPVHDPPVIEELDHRHVFTFNYCKMPGDAAPVSDFDDDNVPGLVFAARATSCFPGAFPPAALVELDDLLTARGEDWEGRENFVTTKLGNILDDDRPAEDVRLIDGSVVSDKPFGAAIAAVTRQPASREVTRRLIYVQPFSSDALAPEDKEEPGFFRTILSSLAEIPRNDPITDELQRVENFNRRMRLIGQVVRQCQPLVSPFVDDILPDDRGWRPTAGEIAKLRDQANTQAGEKSGYAFNSYFHLKLLAVARHLKRLVAERAWPDHAWFPPEHQPAWLSAMARYGIGVTQEGDESALTSIAGEREIEFLKIFDVDFRIRRLRFVIRRLNELYTLATSDRELEADIDKLDEVKATLYGLLEETQRRWRPEFYHDELPEPDRRGDAAALGALVETIGDAMDLGALDAQIDDVFSVMMLNYVPERLRRELFAAYIGFSFFDVLTLPMLQPGDLNEYEEILIDRISPADADAIRTGGARAMLKGLTLRRFGGFFNRAYRENDYLWGRLNGADRLVDIVMGAVSGIDAAREVDVDAIKNRLFTAILDAEVSHLNADPDLIETIRREISAGPR